MRPVRGYGARAFHSHGQNARATIIHFLARVNSSSRL
jgi:hypothetical protein